MAYTTEESNALAAYLAKYNDAKSRADYEMQLNQAGHANQQRGAAGSAWVFPYPPYAQTDETSFYNWLAASDAAAATWQKTASDAKADYDQYLAQINTNSANREAAEASRIAAEQQQRDDDFKAAHPEIYEALEKAGIASTTAITTNQQAIDAQKALAEKDQVYAQSQSKIITWVGIGLAVLVTFGVMYFAFFNKTTPKAE